MKCQYKISQHWFGKNERPLATVLMTMFPHVGMILGEVSTPFLVPTPDYIPVMNIVWFIPAAAALLLCMCTVLLCTISNKFNKIGT